MTQECWTYTSEENTHQCINLPNNMNVWTLTWGKPKKTKVKDVLYHETVFLTLEDCIFYYDKYYFQA